MYRLPYITFRVPKLTLDRLDTYVRHLGVQDGTLITADGAMIEYPWIRGLFEFSEQADVNTGSPPSTPSIAVPSPQLNHSRALQPIVRHPVHPCSNRRCIRNAGE
jgi:hypothetical protein